MWWQNTSKIIKFLYLFCLVSHMTNNHIIWQSLTDSVLGKSNFAKYHKSWRRINVLFLHHCTDCQAWDIIYILVLSAYLAVTVSCFLSRSVSASNFWIWRSPMFINNFISTQSIVQQLHANVLDLFNLYGVWMKQGYIFISFI